MEMQSYVPAFGSGEDVLGHLLGGHGRAGRNLDRNAHVAGGDLNVGAADVDDENFHVELDVSSDRPRGLDPLFRLDDGSADQFVEFGKLAIEIGVTACEDLFLMTGAHAAAGVFTVASVEFFNDVHALDDPCEGSEAGFDIVAGGVVAEVDEDLGGARVRTGVGEGDVAECVVLDERVVGDRDVALLLGDVGFSADAELCPTAGYDAEEARVVVVLRANQLVEPIGAVRRPIAVRFDDKATGGGLELNAIDRWDFVMSEG